MENFKLKIASCLLAAVMCFGFTGCFGSCSDTSTDGATYTIQYSDESGTKQLTVTQGQPYSLDVVPEKTGYNFLGLYDAEVGGTQYVNASGSSVSSFTDGKSIVLYPHYEAKTYTVILDYQGATVTGSRQVTATYGESLPELPKNLTLEHSEFSGWYTKEDCGGVQIADTAGLLPKVSILNEKNFDLSDPDNYVTLYAGFEAEKFTVTFCFEEGMDTEEMQVAYNTPISEVVPKTRVNGNAVLTWSKSSSKTEIFSGKVTEDMVLYAVEYAPVIELDTNGGDEITPVVARAGATIALPTTTRTNYKFAGWQTTSGKTVDYTTMPSSSTTLKAIWQAMIVFNSNGGSSVDSISAAAGASITLPTPEKADFIFAGWYTEDKEQYTKTTMPSASVELKAGWYKAKSETKVLLAETDKVKLSDSSMYRSTKKSYSIDLNEVVESYYSGMMVTINLSFQFMNEDNTGYYDVCFTNSTEISTVTTYWEEKIYADGNTNYQTIEKTVTFSATSSALYLIFRPLPYGEDVYTTMKDVYYTIYYPDTTNLYL